MNNEQQTWILKPGVTFTQAKESDWLHMYPHQLASMRADIPRSIFEQCFVELDVSGLTRQVEESLTFLCQYAYDAGYTTGNDRTVTGKDVDLSIKTTALKIVGLLLNQEKETK